LSAREGCRYKVSRGSGQIRKKEGTKARFWEPWKGNRKGGNRRTIFRRKLRRNQNSGKKWWKETTSWKKGEQKPTDTAFLVDANVQGYTQKEESAKAHEESEKKPRVIDEAARKCRGV